LPPTREPATSDSGSRSSSTLTIPSSLTNPPPSHSGQSSTVTTANTSTSPQDIIARQIRKPPASMSDSNLKGHSRSKRSLSSPNLQPAIAKKQKTDQKAPSKQYGSDSGSSSLQIVHTMTTPHYPKSSSTQAPSSLYTPVNTPPSSSPPAQTKFCARSAFLSSSKTSASSQSSSESNPLACSSLRTLKKRTTPATPSGFWSSPDSLLHSGEVQRKVELMDGTLPTDLNKAVEEAKRTQRIKELYTKRKERYQNRRHELSQNELEIAAAEKEVQEAEKRSA
jgi:hypothetical protein